MEVFHRQVLDSLPGLVFVKDIQGRFIYVNARAAASLGMMSTALLGRTDYDLYAPTFAERYVRDDHNVFTKGQVISSLEEFNLGVGTTSAVYVTKAPFSDEHGSIVGVIVSAIEVPGPVDVLRKELCSAEGSIAPG